MLQHSISYAMIQSAVRKGIRDIRENPRRGIRRLVDLGGMFADGRFQKDFFLLAERELQKADSRYYALVESVVGGTNAEALTRFGMNLGYNAWTKGARTIRLIEERRRFNIPWCLMLDIGEKSPALDMQTLDGLIAQGEALGIFAYFMHVEGEVPEGLLALLAKWRDSAFILCIQPKSVTDELAGALLAAQNIWVNIDLSGDCGDAARILAERACLRGGFCRLSVERGDPEPMLALAERLRLPFLIMIEEMGEGTALPEKRPEALNALRSELGHPVLPASLYADIAEIDRNISTEACVVRVLSDGDVLIAADNAPGAARMYNIKETPLEKILGGAKPKLA